MPFLASEGCFWPPTASTTSEVKNDHAHVIMQGICNKFIEVNFCVGWMVWRPNRMFQDWTFVKYWWEMYFNGIGFTSISLNRPPTHSDGTEIWTVWPRTCSTCTWWEFTKCFITLWIAPSSVYREILRPYCMHLTLFKKNLVKWQHEIPLWTSKLYLQLRSEQNYFNFQYEWMIFWNICVSSM